MSVIIPKTGSLFITSTRLLGHCRTICYFASRRKATHFPSTFSFSTKVSVSLFPSSCSYQNGNSSVLVTHSNLKNICREYGSKRKKKRAQEDASSSDSDSSDDEEDDFSDIEDQDEPDVPSNYRVMTLLLKSLRMDSLVSGGLDIARNRVDEMVFSNKIRYNGGKVLKKSKQISVGDYVDVITERQEDVLKVKRVKLIKISSKKTKTDKNIVKVKVWKQPFEIEVEKADYSSQ